MDVTLMDNVWGDNIRHDDWSWDNFLNVIKHPPCFTEKGHNGIIGGLCKWEDGYGINRKTGEMIIKDGKPVKRAVKGSRKVINRQFLIMDCDYIDDNHFYWNLEDVFEKWGAAWAIYSSFSSSDELEKYRIVSFFDRPVNEYEYRLIARYFMMEIGQRYFDPVSDRIGQVMFLPVRPLVYDDFYEHYVEGYYNYDINEGNSLNADALMNFIESNWDKYSKYIPYKRDDTGKIIENTDNLHSHAQKDTLNNSSDDPRGKNNIVGEFCRMYSISEAIDKFELPYEKISDDLYLYKMSHSKKPGAHIKNDDTLFYSYHSNDPAFNDGRSCSPDLNAWDLVLIHRYNGNWKQMINDFRSGRIKK